MVISPSQVLSPLVLILPDNTAMLATLKEIRDSALANVAGSCPSSAAFSQLVNEATRRLMRRGDWAGTVVRIMVCARRGCVVWPRYVGKVRKINHCQGSALPVRNLWWDFVEENRPTNLCGPELGLVAFGKSPVFQDILGSKRLVRAYPGCPADVGKTVTLFGLDENNQPLRTANQDGTWTEGVKITMAIPFGSTSVFVNRVDRVSKEITQLDVHLYAYDSVNNVLEDMAVYEPGETNPDYERSQLRSGCAGSCGTTGIVSCATSQSVIALVKLKFIPASVGTDLVLIQNLDALKLMVQAIKFSEAGDRTSAQAYEADAIRELNLELRDESPIEEMPVSFGEFANNRIGQQRCF